MIRVNLMPQVTRRGGAQVEAQSQGWLVAALAAALVMVVICFVIYGMKQEELENWRSKSAQVQAEIELSQSRVTDHEQIKAQLQKLREREEAIAKLQSARTGPTAALLEIAKILTRGRGPSVSPDKLAEVEKNNPLAKFNPEWDARRVWLTEFREEARRVVLTGQARDGEDVSELARRMNLSSYFHDVRLLPAKRNSGDGTKADWVSFQLEAQVRY